MNVHSKALALSVLVLATVVAVPDEGRAQIPPADQTVILEPVVSGLTSPLSVTHAGDGSGRLFILEQTGQIRILENGFLLPTPFLDVADKLPTLGSFFDERGLLGLAFHPDYENNGRFFVRYSTPRDGDPAEPCNDPNGFIVGCHSAVLAEYHVSGGNPNVADPASEIVLLTVDEPQFNHNAGDLAFGPDGFLYVPLGDGGGANDGLADVPPSHGPIGNGQNIETLLGSVLRIDVDSASPPLPYSIPADNPFVGVPGADEIFAYGMRNPYRLSFDDGPGGIGTLYVADVGQDLFEEVNVVSLGGNYGWVIREGFHCFDPFNPGTPPSNCPSTGPLGEPLLDPLVEYSHPGSGFFPEGGITVVGGFVYRGGISPTLYGRYIFGDFAQEFVVPSGRLFILEDAVPSGAAPEIRELVIGNRPSYGLFLKGFGEDEDGELYVCGSTELAPGGTGGTVERIRGELPTAIDSFQAARVRDIVVVRWEISASNGHEAYMLYRENGSGSREPLTRNWLSGSSVYSYSDETPPAGTARYWLDEIDGRGLHTWYGPATVPALVRPLAREGFTSEPNPFRVATSLSFSLDRDSEVQLRIYDASGRRVATLVDRPHSAGRHEITWNARDGRGERVAAGVYYARLEAAGVQRMRKIVVLN